MILGAEKGTFLQESIKGNQATNWIDWSTKLMGSFACFYKEVILATWPSPSDPGYQKKMHNSIAGNIRDLVCMAIKWVWLIQTHTHQLSTPFKIIMSVRKRTSWIWNDTVVWGRLIIWPKANAFGCQQTIFKTINGAWNRNGISDNSYCLHGTSTEQVEINTLIVSHGDTILLWCNTAISDHLFVFFARCFVYHYGKGPKKMVIP